MRTKSIFVKLLISILIILTLTSIIGTMKLQMNYSFADSSEEKVNDLMANNDSGMSGGIVNALKNLALAPFRGMRSINYYLASSAGTTEDVTEGEITPFDIFFNKFALLDANIFSTTGIDENSIVYQIRTNTALWYYAVRTLAISIISIMLIWNLIRSISKNTSADQKAIAKNSLTDWLLSFALIMFMHIIIIVVLNFNDVILESIENFGLVETDTSNFFDALENAVFAQNFVLGVASLIVYALLNWQTFKYILVYIQRFLTLVLLIMISPIIPVTYSTDRMRGGKGAALNSWLRELLFNVFLQTLHAIVYAALVGVAMSSLTAESITNVAALGPALIAVAAMLFIKYAEKMVKTIFGFDSSQVINTNVFANAATTIGNVATSINNLGQRVTTGTATRFANGNGSGITFGQNISDANAGIGQNAGTGTSNPIRGRRASFLGGIGGIITGRNGANGQNGEATASATATATATATVDGKDTKATATAKNDEATSEASDVYDTGGASVEENERDDKQDRKQNKSDERLDKLEEIQDETDQKPKRADEMFAENFKNFMASYIAGSQTDNKTETKSKKTTEEEHETETIKEEIHEEIETENIEQKKDEKESSKKSEAPSAVISDAKTDDLKEMKDMIKAAISDNKARLDELRTETKNQLNELKSSLDNKTTDDIERKINSTWDKPEELGKYIKGLPEGSDERKYAELYARFNSLMAIDDDMSKEEKIEIITTLDKAKGIELSERFEKKVAEDSSQLDNLHVTSKSVENRTPTETNVTEIKPEEGVKEETIETEAKVTGVTSLKDEAIKRAQDILLKLGVKAEDELEIQSDFQTRYDATASEIGIKEPTMEDIVKSLSPAAQREYRDYTSGKLGLDAVKNTDALNAIALEREADAIRKIQNEAQKEGFEMNVENTEYHGTVTINGRTETFTSNSVGGTITNLSRIREEEKRKQAERTKSKLA